MSEPKPEKSSRFHHLYRWLWRGTKWLVIVVIAVGLTYVLSTNYRGKRAADDMLRELKDRSIPPVPAERLPDEENAARFYLAAAELLTFDQELINKIPVNGHADWPLFGEGFSPEQAALLKDVILENELGFKALRRIKPGHKAQFDLDAADDFPKVMQALAKGRRVARWYKLDSLQATSEDDLDRAVEDCLAVLRLSRQFSDDDYTIVALVRISIAALSRGTIESLLSRATLTDEQLEALCSSLQATEASFDFPGVLRHKLYTIPADLRDPQFQLARGEYITRRWARYTRNLIAMMNGEILDEEDLFARSAGEWFMDALELTFITWCPGYIRLATVEMAEQVLAIHDEVNDPATSTQRLVELSKQKPDHDVLAGVLAPLRTHLKIQAELRAAEAALEVERFRLREDRWPRDLAEVYAEVPVGPYGHQLRLISRGDEMRVYSIGPNGVDDQGIQEFEYELLSDIAEEDDLAFILLNPDQRNRPATTIIDDAPAQSIFKELRDLVAEINGPYQNEANAEEKQ